MDMTKRLVFNRNRRANETIYFQNDKFGDDLTEVFSEIYEYMDANPGTTLIKLMRLGFNERLESLIKARTGLSLNIQFSQLGGGACVMVFPMNQNHIFMTTRDYFRHPEEQSAILKDPDKVKGTVDIESAKVTGVFSEYVHECHISVISNRMTSLLTAGEQAAVLMHEIGHVFTFYEYSDRLETTNQIMADLVKSASGKNKYKVREYAFKELAKVSGVKPDAFEDMVKEDNNIIFGAKMFKFYFEFVESQMLNKAYDATSAEQMADNFAARFGYGKQLISGLYKIYGMGGHYALYKPTRWLLYMLEFIWLFGRGLVLIHLMMVSIPLAVLFGIFVLAILYLFGDGVRDMTYDDVKTRYLRVREQMIEVIKTTDDNVRMKQLLEEIYAVDEIIKSTVNYSFMLRPLSNMLFSSNGHAATSMEFQRTLEVLANNDLFLKAAELKVRGM